MALDESRHGRFDARPMAEIHQASIVPFNAAQMFGLVNGVARYGEFLPWCERAEVLSESDTAMRARLFVRKGKLHYMFTTDNRLQPPYRIEMTLVDGPFKRLHGTWRFEDNPLGCRVCFDLDYEFASKLLGLTLSPLFKAVTGSLVQSFKDRARQLYGGS